MASNRKKRRDACEGKTRHTSEYNAILSKVKTLGWDDTHAKAYKCRFCGYWHWGHRFRN